jgi:hypothetical protein
LIELSTWLNRMRKYRWFELSHDRPKFSTVHRIAAKRKRKRTKKERNKKTMCVKRYLSHSSNQSFWQYWLAWIIFSTNAYTKFKCKEYDWVVQIFRFRSLSEENKIDLTRNILISSMNKYFKEWFVVRYWAIRRRKKKKKKKKKKKLQWLWMSVLHRKFTSDNYFFV